MACNTKQDNPKEPHKPAKIPVDSSGVGGDHHGVDEVVHVAEVGDSHSEALQVVHGHARAEEAL